MYVHAMPTHLASVSVNVCFECVCVCVSLLVCFEGVSVNVFVSLLVCVASAHGDTLRTARTCSPCHLPRRLRNGIMCMAAHTHPLLTLCWKGGSTWSGWGHAMLLFVCCLLFLLLLLLLLLLFALLLLCGVVLDVVYMYVFAVFAVAFASLAQVVPCETC
jgi:hypothetical protein